MQEYLCNDFASILAPILLLLTLVNAAMVLTAYKAEDVSGEDNEDERPDKLLHAVLQRVYACQTAHLIAQQQQDIHRLTARVAELCEWLGQLAPMVHSNEHLAERLLSVSMQQRRRIEMLQHRLGHAEDVLGAFVERKRQQKEERKERARWERAGKGKAGIWEVSGKRLRRVGREEELRGGRDQEWVEEEIGSGGERGFQLVGENSGNFAAQGMEESQILQQDETYPAQSKSPLPFFDGVYDPHQVKMEQGQNRGVFGRPGGSRQNEAPRRSLSQEPFIWAARGGNRRHPAAGIREV